MIPQEKLDDWEESFSAYTDENWPIHNGFPSPSDNESTLEVVKAFLEIGKEFSAKFQSHDNLEVLRYERNPQEIHIHSTKFGTNIFFGFDYKGFYLNNILAYQEHFKSTKDEFWIKFISLFKFGEVEIRESYSSSLKSFELYEKQTAYNKSEILKAVSSIVFQIAEDNRLEQIDIEVKLGRDKSFGEIILNAQKIFETFYRLNYMLYKVEYLKLRRHKE